MFEVVAVNVENRPNEIPISKWIKKGVTYTVKKMDYMNIQNRILGFKLEEIDIDDCFPYQYFAASRFRPKTEEDDKLQTKFQDFFEEAIK